LRASFWQHVHAFDAIRDLNNLISLSQQKNNCQLGARPNYPEAMYPII
jgi:hypothetical protein